MNTSIKNTPKDIFLHLFNIVTFYMSVVSYIMLLTQYVTVLFPDPLSYYYQGTLNSIFWSTSILVIAFAAYIFTSRLMERDFSREPQKRELAVRKWLVYLTLFIAAVTVLGDLITLLYNFLNGELTVSFFLKILIVLAVAAAVFGYYFWDLKHHEKPASARRGQIAWITSVVVLISVVIGFIIAGSPATQRARRLDEQRVNDLQSVQNQVLNFWIRKSALPQTAQELEDPFMQFSFPRDPDTGIPYEYKPTGELSFEICADFHTNTSRQSGISDGTRATKITSPAGIKQTDDIWTHAQGHICFTRSIDPELYKPDAHKEKILPPVQP